MTKNTVKTNSDLDAEVLAKLNKQDPEHEAKMIAQFNARVNSEELQQQATEPQKPSPAKAEEVGGQSGLEPTRFGDWEKKGRCSDF